MFTIICRDPEKREQGLQERDSVEVSAVDWPI